MSGFFLGGLAKGFMQEQALSQQGDYQQGQLSLGQQHLQIEQQRLQNQEQNQQKSEYLDLASQWSTHIADVIQQHKEAETRYNPNAPPDAINSKVIKDLMPAVSKQKDMIKQLYSKLGLDPSIIDAQVTDAFNAPAKSTIMAAEAAAKEGPQKRQLTDAEIALKRAQTGALGGNPDSPAPGEGLGDQRSPNQRVAQAFDATTQAAPAKKMNDPQAIAEAIRNLDQPPVFTGLYRMGAPVRAELERQGVNVSQLQMQWKRAEKEMNSLNGPQMIRFVGLAHSVMNTIDEVNGLAKQMDNSGVPALNALKLAKYIQTEGNSPNGQLAAKYIASVNTLKEEFANLANGGYAPTDAAWALANQQINANYGVKELGASLDQIQRLFKIRLNAIPGMGELGPGANNVYAPTKKTPANATDPSQLSDDEIKKRLNGIFGQ